MPSISGQRREPTRYAVAMWRRIWSSGCRRPASRAGIRRGVVEVPADAGVVPVPDRSSPLRDPLAPRRTHFAAKARSVIFLYMDGGPSQVDTFDPKPRLDREHGQPIKVKTHPTQFNNVGNVLACPWKFRQYGESGIPVSDLFPRVGQCVDDLAIVRSMVSNFSEHTNANYFLHTGSGLQGRPSQGAWVTYGLGSECQDLPAFVVLNGGLIPPGGMDCFNSGFLPAAYQGSIFRPTRRPLQISRPASRPRAASGKSSSCCTNSTRACWDVWAITIAWKRRSPTTNWPFACSPPSPS